MINDYFITTSVSMICMVFTAIIMILFLLKKEMKKVTAKLFFGLIICGLISMLSYFIAGYYATIDPRISEILGRVLCFTIQTFQWFFMFYMGFIFMTKEQQDHFNEYYKNATLGLGVLIMIVDAVLCTILDFEFRQNAPGLPFGLTGALSTYTNAVYGVALAIAIILMFRFRKQMDKLSKKLFIFAVASWLVTFLFETLTKSPINDMPATQTFFLLFLYLSIENQDQAILEEYIRTQKETEETNKLRSKFVMNMSHQLRTPMNTILGFSELLINNPNLTLEIVHQDTKTMKDASRNLLNLIDSILEISKLEGHKNVLNEENYKLENIIYEVNNIILEDMRKDDVMFYIEGNAEVTNDLHGDEIKLINIISTIILTAAEHTSYGSVKLVVDSNKIDDQTEEIIFHIMNTGHLMKEEVFNRTFDDIIEFKGNENAIVDASMLKLVVAKSLIELLGAEIEFINEKGKGTQYIVKIKQKVTGNDKLGNINEKIKLYLASFENKKDLSNKKVLVIEDNELDEIVVRRLLEEYKLSIQTTKSPKEAIEILKQNKYDAVFVKYTIKEMNGENFIKNLKQVIGELPIMVAINPIISEYKDQDIRKEGYTYVLDSPIDNKLMNKCINKIFKESE